MVSIDRWFCKGDDQVGMISHKRIGDGEVLGTVVQGQLGVNVPREISTINS